MTGQGVAHLDQFEFNSKMLPISDSPESETASIFFGNWEKLITDWDSAIEWISKVRNYASFNKNLVWRGVSNAKYPLHSSLYRLLVRDNVEVDEQLLVDYEKKIVDTARHRWRFDGVGALELFAHLQHYGAPSRFLDVTYNPLIALWFASRESRNAVHPKDGRLFIFDVTDREIMLDDANSNLQVPWTNEAFIRKYKWQKDLPHIWRPPSYIERIAAQDAAFLVGGVPQAVQGKNVRYRKKPGDGTSMGTWSIEKIRESTSVGTWMKSLNRKVGPTSTPTFTLRVDKRSKREIQQMLDINYGINAATLFPERYGLAQYITSEIARLEKSPR